VLKLTFCFEATLSKPVMSRQMGWIFIELDRTASC